MDTNEWARAAVRSLLKRLGEQLLREAVLLTVAAERCMGRRP
jgi:hypothetical protein